MTCSNCSFGTLGIWPTGPLYTENGIEKRASESNRIPAKEYSGLIRPVAAPATHPPECEPSQAGPQAMLVASHISGPIHGRTGPCDLLPRSASRLALRG